MLLTSPEATMRATHSWEKRDNWVCLQGKLNPTIAIYLSSLLWLQTSNFPNSPSPSIPYLCLGFTLYFSRGKQGEER